MIADHDFDRKVNDVKKYLERGDLVKVKHKCLGWCTLLNNCRQYDVWSRVQYASFAIMFPPRLGSCFQNSFFTCYCVDSSLVLSHETNTTTAGGIGGEHVATQTVRELLERLAGEIRGANGRLRRGAYVLYFSFFLFVSLAWHDKTTPLGPSRTRDSADQSKNMRRHVHTQQKHSKNRTTV